MKFNILEVLYNLFLQLLIPCEKEYIFIRTDE